MDDGVIALSRCGFRRVVVIAKAVGCHETPPSNRYCSAHLRSCSN